MSEDNKETLSEKIVNKNVQIDELKKERDELKKELGDIKKQLEDAEKEADDY